MVSYRPLVVPHNGNMPEALLPLFPLEVVLLPGTPLPLHIFEDRYKEMIGYAIENRTEFGIVQAGERGILNIGCSATVEQVVERYPDGRMDILVTGRRRFEINTLDGDKPWLQASVTFFNDEEADPAPVELKAMALAGVKALQSVEEVSEASLPDHRDPLLSFKIAYFVQDLVLRQTLLALRSETERLKHLNSFLPEYVARLRRTNHARRVAPKNGHGMIRIADGDAS